VSSLCLPRLCSSYSCGKLFDNVIWRWADVLDNCTVHVRTWWREEKVMLPISKRLLIGCHLHLLELVAQWDIVSRECMILQFSFSLCWLPLRFIGISYMTVMLFCVMFFLMFLVHNFIKDSIVKSVFRSRLDAVKDVRLSFERC